MQALMLISLLTIAAPVRPERPSPSKPLQEQILGNWQVINALSSGKPQTVLKPGEATFHIQADKMIIRMPGKEWTYQFSVDPAHQPASINIMLEKSSTSTTKGRPNTGIVKIEGDTLTICLNPMARPTEFLSTAESKTVLWQMKRIK